MKKLYKRDSKGKIRTLELSTEGSLFVQVSGIIDGKKVRHEKECKPKNRGKSNATTAIGQADIECAAKLIIKLSEGYFETKEEAEDEEVLMPMLAKVYDEHSKKIDWESDVFVQPKLDGMRCLAVIKEGKVTLLSRKNKEIVTMDHIASELVDLPDMILDGELYAHGKTFQENMKLIKKYRKDKSEEVKFHTYDMVMDKPFDDRYDILEEIHATPFRNIDLVETIGILDEDSIKGIHSEYLKDGYEGTMIRWGDSGYKVNGRSHNLLKYKDFQDITAKIIDIEPAEQRPTWGVPVLSCTIKNVDGSTRDITFRAGTKMSHDEREDLLQNKGNFIGQTGEVRFFEWTDEGLPRFPILVGFRLDK